MSNKQDLDWIGDNHISTRTDIPLLSTAFDKSDDEKMANIQFYFAKIMEEMGLDLRDDSLSGTPYRVAKMYIKELFSGLDPANKPSYTTFENKFGYSKMLIEQDITIQSSCEHHFLPIVGQAHVAYIPKERVIGLSKINRLVDYLSRRPQVQERLCLQIKKELQDILQTKDVIVVLHTRHLCVSSRGIKDKSSFTTTIEYDGRFEKEAYRNEFFACLGHSFKS